MARDETMLQMVCEDPSAVLFRFYRWSEPTLSLGYFQSYGEALEDPRWRNVPIVRRPTGGGAIWHHHELTYAIVVPRDHALAKDAASLYFLIHRIAAHTLEGWHVKTDQRWVGKSERDRSARVPASERSFLCFNDHAPNDVLIGRNKVIGSAQRRRKGAVLQHGSILFRQSDRTPEFPGILDAFKGSAHLLDEVAWPSHLASTLSSSLAKSLEHTPWPESMLRHSETIERDVYRNDAWTRRR